MKHLLNDLTEKEKNSIREQHTGGMKVVTENFSKLINAKSGNVKPLVNEREGEDYSDLEKEFDKFSSDDKSPSDCEDLFKSMDFIYDDFMSQISSPDEMDEAEAEDTYDEFESELGGILDLSDDMGCDNKTRQNLEIEYEAYLSEMADKLGLSCEHLFKRMDFIYDYYMSQISSPDEMDEAEAEDTYDQFETELAGILDKSNRMDCDDKTKQDLEIVYNEYLAEMADKLGL